MKKVMLSFAVLMGTAILVFAQATAYHFGQTAVSLNAVAATGAGTVYSMPTTGAGNPSRYTWQTIYTGTPLAITVNLEGSLDDTTFFQLDQSTSTAGETRSVVNKPSKFVRCNISSYTVNGSTATCQFIAAQ